MAELRRYRRYDGYDYSRGAALFITITTKPRRQVFGKVTDAKMELSPLGKEAAASIVRIFNTHELTLYRKVVMPDHVHFSIHLKPGMDNDAARRLLNRATGKFKSWINRCYWQHGGQGALWQQGYHDWICLGREMIDSVQRYIEYNPLKWEMRNNRGLLEIIEPVESPLLAPDEYWRAIGALKVLQHERTVIALRVSRTNTQSRIDELVKRLESESRAITIMSGFISPGERQVLDMLLKRKDAQIIKVMPYALPHDYAPPVAWMEAIKEGRMAIIARGNSPEEMSRQACLDMNAVIAGMADKAVVCGPHRGRTQDQLGGGEYGEWPT